MEYHEIGPMPALAGAVERIWMLEAAAGRTEVAPQPVLPDGRPELVLHFGDRFAELVSADSEAQLCPDRRIVQPRVIVAGQLTRQLLLQPTGRVSVLGVRFLPYGAASVFAVPQHELSGLTLDLGALAPGLLRELGDLDACEGDLRRAADAVQQILARWIRPRRIDPRLPFAVAAIGRSGGRLSVERLAAAAGVTRRHLERQFLAAVGITPKRLARITRFQQALRLLERDSPHRTGADTATACGYTDQSHFIREFRDLAGCSPSQHLLRRGEMTGFFVGGHRLGIGGTGEWGLIED